MGVQPYDITRYQDVLFAADSFGQIADELLAFFDGFDDDRAVALGATGARR
jgi:phenylalanine-4-hydroxylase